MRRLRLVASIFLERDLDLPPFDFATHTTNHVGHRSREIDLIPGVRLNLPARRSAEGEIEMPLMNGVSVGQNYRALDAVLQLAHVPRPGVGFEVVERGWRQYQQFLVQILAELVDEMARQDQHIVATLAQGRNLDREHRQAEVQILADLTLVHSLFEVAVRRRYDASVDVKRLRTADTLELLLLEGSQDLGLEREWQIADLVEEERAAMGQLESSWLALRGACERALFVAEQLALEQGLGGSTRAALWRRVLSQFRFHPRGGRSHPSLPRDGAAVTPDAVCRLRR